VTEELEHLWALRGLDDSLGVLRAALARFPAERAGLERRVTAERARLEALKTRLGEMQLKRRQLEKDIEAAASEERKYQTQLFSVKKNEEYTALLHEIAAVKAKRSDVETEVLMLLEDEERAARERPLIEQAMQAAEREAAERKASIAEEESRDRARLEALEAERATHLGALPAPTRTRYERIHGSREGRAVVPIAKGACGGCFRAQPPQVLQEAKRGDRLLTCDGCGRLLIWPPETP
jgi:predicted  nucleic acid-binding Zn-ribbon protein